MAQNINNGVIIELGAKYDFALDYIIKNNLYDFIMAYPGHRMYLAIKIGEELRGEESLNVQSPEDILIRAAVNIFDGIHSKGEKMISYIKQTGNFEKLLMLCPDFENEFYPKKDQKNERLIFHMQVLFMLEFYKNSQLGKLEPFITSIEAFVFAEETSNKIQNQLEKPDANSIPIKEKSDSQKTPRTKVPNKFAIISLLFLSIAYFTNPSDEKHVNSVKANFNRNYLVENMVFRTQDQRDNLLNTVVAPLVSSEHYYIFSLTYFGNEAVGFGLLGNVFIYNELEQSLVFHNPKAKKIRENKSTLDDEINQEITSPDIDTSNELSNSEETDLSLR